MGFISDVWILVFFYVHFSTPPLQKQLSCSFVDFLKYDCSNSLTYKKSSSFHLQCLKQCFTKTVTAHKKITIQVHIQSPKTQRLEICMKSCQIKTYRFQSSTKKRHIHPYCDTETNVNIPPSLSYFTKSIYDWTFEDSACPLLTRTTECWQGAKAFCLHRIQICLW